jgi:predicted ATPase/class 3 adenylate cyclase
VRDLPIGTVTFLFSDIEGSTKLLQAAAGDYANLLETHAGLIRTAIADAGGVEVSTDGDAFFAVFGSPVGAVAAAYASQQALSAHPWPEGRTVKVRMGLHTGEGIRGGDNYAGLDVNRAARIAAAAHGGQVLLSDATRALVERDLPAGASLRDLGSHRLKDLDHPEHLHQLVIEGCQPDFPAPRGLDARPNNLPAQLTRFIGRGDVLADIAERLMQARLLTLTGPGGTGKTRLALRTAMDLLTKFRDGAFFVDLSTLMDAALVGPTIAEALGVGESPGRTAVEMLAEHLKERELLLVLDNYEQVTDAASVVADLLTAAPKLTVLATSRIPLHIYGENEFPVQPLVLPDPAALPDAEAVSQYEAVALFVDRARAAKPDFEITDENAPAIAEICYRLDGLPLALELAASRVKLLSPQAMLPKLGHRLQLLTTGARDLPERQRTLRGAIEWSHDLLDDAHRALFARLAAFMGGATFESVDAVTNPGGELAIDTLDGLADLVDESLLRQTEEEGEARFTMLETIREYAEERLESAVDAADVRRRHAEHFVALAEEAEPHLTGAEQAAWLSRVEREHDNIRMALRWSLEGDDPQPALRIVGALWRFFHQRGHLDEGRRWADRAVETAAGEVNPHLAKALTGAGGIAYWQNDYPVARRHYEAALETWRQVGDAAGIANALYDMAFMHLVEGDRTASRAALEESAVMARTAGDRLLEANASYLIAYEVIRDDDTAAALVLLQDATATFREVGNLFGVADALTGIAVVQSRLGRPADGRAALREAIGLFREADNPTGLNQCVWSLAAMCVAEDRPEEALILYGADETLRELVGGGAPREVLTSVYGDPAVEAREALSAEDADSAWERGRKLSPEEIWALVERILAEP